MNDESYKGQLQLGVDRLPQNDRNYDLGGRSFYFFDFDDNILFLSTEILAFHKVSGAEVAFSSADWANVHGLIGHPGPFENYEIRYGDRDGSFRHFRDHDPVELERLGRKWPLFLDDMSAALGFPDLQWKGPSWECFYHAVFNQRPVSLITARGHHPETLKAGIRLLIEKGHLPLEPNYLSIFPVNHEDTRRQLGAGRADISVAELKQKALRASVEKAIEVYGPNPHHRFGMSDDDPKNIQLMLEEMTRLKNDYPEMSFFMIETHKGQFVKHEVAQSGLPSKHRDTLGQLSLFGKKPTEV